MPTCTPQHFVRHARKLDVAVLSVLEPLLKVLESIAVEIEKVDVSLAALSETEPVVQLLMTAPGVGPIVAACFVSVIDDAKRFSSPHHVESYVGLVPTEDSSGGRKRLGSISKKGNGYLRALLVQGAWSIMRAADRRNPLRLWADAVAERRGRKVAVIALARRLVGVLWAMWRDGTPYDASLLARASARGTQRTAESLLSNARSMAAATRTPNVEMTLQA